MFLGLSGLRKSAKESIIPSKVQFDLTRISIDLGIQELETGTRPTNSLGLVPRYFSEEYTDPYTGEYYLCDASSENFYSSGPDPLDLNSRIMARSMTSIHRVRDQWFENRKRMRLRVVNLMSLRGFDSSAVRRSTGASVLHE